MIPVQRKTELCDRETVPMICLMSWVSQSSSPFKLDYHLLQPVSPTKSMPETIDITSQRDQVTKNWNGINTHPTGSW